MDIRKYVEQSQDVQELAKAVETGIGRALLTAARLREAQLVTEIVENPTRSDAISETVEYKLGMIAGLRFSQTLINAVRRYVDGLSEKEK